MEIMFTNKRSARRVTVLISIILIFSTVGMSTGDQTKNIADKFDSHRDDITYVSVVPSSQTVKYGDTFSIIVHVDPGEPIIGVQIDLSFNPTLVQVDSVTQADPVWGFFGPPTVDNTNGMIIGAGVAVMGTTVTTPTDCFNITFTAQSTDGTSPLDLQNVLVADQNAEPVSSLVAVDGEVTVGSTPNNPPSRPERPWGPTTGQYRACYTYNTTTTDPDGDEVYYLWDWGDGTQSKWLGPYASGTTTQATHTWTDKGSFEIKVKAKDTDGLESDWSDPLPIKMPMNSASLSLLSFFMFFEWVPLVFHILQQLLEY